MGAYQRNLRRIDLSTLAAGKTVIISGGQLGVGIGSIRVWQIQAMSSAQTIVTPFSRSAANVDTQVGGAIDFITSEEVVLPQSEQPWMECLPGQSLVWQSSNAVTLTGSLWYSLA